MRNAAEKYVSPASLEAYKQANEDHRHYGKLRWTMVTIFVTVSVALFTIALHDQVRTEHQFWFPCAGGILLGLVFLGAEVRLNIGLEAFVNGIKRLEHELGIRSISTAPTPFQEFLRKTLAPLTVGSIYGGAVLLWIAAIVARKWT